MCLFLNFGFSHRSHAVSTQRTNNGVAHCSAGVRWNFCREKHQILIAHGTDIPGCSLEDALVPHCPLSLSLNAPSSSPPTPEYLRFRDPLARPSWLWQVYLKKVSDLIWRRRNSRQKAPDVFSCSAKLISDATLVEKREWKARCKWCGGVGAQLCRAHWSSRAAGGEHREVA